MAFNLFKYREVECVRKFWCGKIETGARSLHERFERESNVNTMQPQVLNE